jgi:hypothetical protein
MAEQQYSPPALYGVSMNQWGNSIYLFGGTNGEEIYNQIYEFNLGNS